MRSPWTNIEIKVLKALYPDYKGAFVAKVLRRSIKSVYDRASSMKIGKSDEFKKSFLSGRMNALRIMGVDYRFEKGQIPFNKGLSWNEFMPPEKQQESLKTTFKKGHLPHNTKKDGEISIRRDMSGRYYKYIRISTAIWVALHVYNWEKMYGDVPDGFIVVFKTSDRMNCDVSNLELITREENMLRNSIHRYPEELRLTMKTLKKLNQQINGK